ncbi:MAG: hypothetical protein GXY54_04350 [Deltaproteobacteria bacterium]|nr:hypothetical protein [Deltaproteobacteria bacterium]
MKKALCGLLFFVLALPFLAFADSPPAKEIRIYQDASYSGSASNLSRNQANLVNTGWNDKISSIQLGSDVLKVIVYEHINYKGKKNTIKGNTNFGGTWWNDKISSLEIYLMPEPPASGTVRFYWDGEYSGSSFEASGVQEDANLVDSGWNDRISSIMIGSAAKVKVCEHINFGGTCKTYQSNVDFSGTWWNDKVSSYRVLPK